MNLESMSEDEFDHWVGHLHVLAIDLRWDALMRKEVPPGAEEFVAGVDKLAAKTFAKFEGSEKYLRYAIRELKEHVLRTKTFMKASVEESGPGRPSLNPKLAAIILTGLLRAHRNGNMLRAIHEHLKPGGDFEVKWKTWVHGEPNGFPTIPREANDNENWAQELKRICWRAVYSELKHQNVDKNILDQEKTKTEYFAILRATPIGEPDYESDSAEDSSG